jgi:hypothetical protein
LPLDSCLCHWLLVFATGFLSVPLGSCLCHWPLVCATGLETEHDAWDRYLSVLRLEG